MSLLAIAVALAMAAVLLRAGLGKVRHPGDLATTMVRLGVPRRTARHAAVAVVIAEFATAIALVFRPDAGLTQIAIVFLAVAFAAAGLRAIGLDERIACNCFGSGSGDLGLRQVVMLIPWMAAAAILRLGAPALAAQDGAAWFAAIAAGIAALEAAGVVRAMREGRDDRQSAEEMIPWLPSY